METPQPSQVSVSGHIVLQGQLPPASSAASPDNVPAFPPPPWWKLWQRWKDFHKVTAYATLLLAGGTIALAVFTLCLVIDVENAAERQLRAYLYVGSFDTHFEKNPDGSSTFTVTPSSKVFGKTPAASVHPIWVLVMSSSSPGSTAFVRDQGTGSTNNLVQILGQDHKIGPKSIKITNTDIEDLKNHTKMIVAVGTATYRDVFKKDRWTDFCVAFNWNDLTNNNAQLCHTLNDADWSGDQRTRADSIVLPPQN
jgi:hypothetical protein